MIRICKLALPLCLIAGSAQAQIINWKHWTAPTWFYTLPEVRPEGYQPTGFPERPNFTKLLDETVLRCEFAGDFVGEQSGVLATDIDIDDGVYGVGNGVYAPGGYWNTQFWSYTWAHVTAGEHQIRILMTSIPAMQAVFYAQYSSLKCFEELAPPSQADTPPSGAGSSRTLTGSGQEPYLDG